MKLCLLNIFIKRSEIIINFLFNYLFIRQFLLGFSLLTRKKKPKEENFKSYLVTINQAKNP